MGFIKPQTTAMLDLIDRSFNRIHEQHHEELSTEEPQGAIVHDLIVLTKALKMCKTDDLARPIGKILSLVIISPTILVNVLEELEENISNRGVEVLTSIMEEL